MSNKTITDIYGTKITTQTTPSDYFRIDYIKSEQSQSNHCISLGYEETQELFTSIEKYLKERDLLPKK